MGMTERSITPAIRNRAFDAAAKSPPDRDWRDPGWVAFANRRHDISGIRGVSMMRKAVLALAAMVGVLAYLGLAVLGWGGLGEFFAHPARVVLAITAIALAGVASFTGGNLSPGEREDRGNRWIIAALGAIGLLSAYLPAYCDRVDFWTIDGDGLRWLGVALFAVGGALRLRPVFVLGHRFSGLVAIQPDHELVTHGVYAKIRHPSYAGLLLNAIGWALAFRSALGVMLTALMIPPLLARMRAEEALLSSHFGAEYDSYRARTWRLIPGLY
jgi:protein-S-isoprenylcysteine O-methyltransferase Ste14